jgi:hypothetical protein
MGKIKINPLVYAVSGLLFVLLMAVSSRYGFQRDEVYFLDCARHLAVSYVDQPGFAPLLARVSLDLFGVSPSGMRVWPALAAAAMVVIGGLTAREFGGGRRAQLLAAVGCGHHDGGMGRFSRGQHDGVPVPVLVGAGLRGGPDRAYR